MCHEEEKTLNYLYNSLLFSTKSISTKVRIYPIIPYHTYRLYNLKSSPSLEYFFKINRYRNSAISTRGYYSTLALAICSSL